MQKVWWKEAIVYQIYPRSFKDSNGDGIGDLRGIIEKVDYIKKLGVDVVWLNPVYCSPNDDNGYDISDYQNIMPEFGTMGDWEELLEKLHTRNIKLIMDLVVNHTSDEHIWFMESRKDRESKFRDYYIWRPASKGNQPNNWKSVFSGSAWELDKKTGEYYMHIFSKKQPDLNWECEDVRLKVYEMMKWWLNKGIDGFRMDVINMLSKPESFENAPNKYMGEQLKDISFYTNGPKIHNYLKEMNQKVLSNYDIMTVGECPGTTIKQGLEYVNEVNKELNMIFHFEHVDIDYGPGGERWAKSRLDLVKFKNIFLNWENVLYGKGWNSIYLMNHDQPRAISRYGNDTPEYRVTSAKMLASFQLTMPGTPYIYMGEEIGMTNVAYKDIKDYKDLETINYYNYAIKTGKKSEDLMNAIHFRSRDNSRTPIQWDNSDNAGFTSSTPWIKVNSNYKEINIHNALNDPDSIFYYYQKLIKLRKEHLLFVYGTFELIMPDDTHIFAFKRTFEGQSAIVILNFSENKQSFESEIDKEYKLLTSNYKETAKLLSKKQTLQAYEASIYID